MGENIFEIDSSLFTYYFKFIVGYVSQALNLEITCRKVIILLYYGENHNRIKKNTFGKFNLKISAMEARQLIIEACRNQNYKKKKINKRT